MKKQLLRAAVASAIALLVTPSAFAQTRAASGTPYKIGAILSLSGQGADISLPARQTFDLLVKRFNDAGGVQGHPIELVYRDDGGDESRAVTAAKDLASDPSILGILGPSLSGLALAVVPVAEEQQIPVIALASSAKIINPVKKWVFKTPVPDTVAMAQIVHWASAQGWKNLATLTDSNALGEGERQSVVDAAERQHVTVDNQEKYATADPSTATQLTRIAHGSAQAIVQGGTDPGRTTVAKSALQVGLKLPVLTFGAAPTADLLAAIGQGSAKWYLLTDAITVQDQLPASNPQKKLMVVFAADFKKTYGEPPTSHTSYAFDAFQIMSNALMKGGSASRVALRNAIEQTKGVRGMQGIFNMSPDDHLGIQDGGYILSVVDNGKLRVVSMNP
jgi:branched-chain amino acid transport system substrate-binding protein